MGPAIIALVTVILVVSSVMVYLMWLLFSSSLPGMGKGGAFYLWVLGLGATAMLVGLLSMLLRQP
ncbi:MAG: hypothetical protein R6V12_16865 [Candidatus Hydrogenedentota bacterium]